MPSTHTFEHEALSHGQTLPIQLLLGLPTKIILTTRYLVAFFVNSSVMVLTLGAPYLQYKLYKYDQELNDASSDEMYSEMIKALDAQWDTYSRLSLNMLPLPFPMVSASGVALCSTTSFVAMMTFTAGVVSVATSTIYRLKFKALRDECVINEWLKASQGPWHRVSNKSFWVLVSLPSLVFFLSVGLLIATAVFTVWERPVAGVTPSREMHDCPVKKLQTFKFILLATLGAVFTHFVFVITKMYSMNGWEAIEITNAAV